MTIAIAGLKGWDDWLTQCLAPLPGGASGSDPRYGERFSTLKAEVEKKQEVDYERILKLSTDILSQEAKDLRVASYFVLGAGRVYGLEGLVWGVRLLTGLLAMDVDQCYPQKPKARLSAIGWLQQPRILHFVQKHDSQVPEALFVEAKESWESFATAAGEAGIEGFGWPDLFEWLRKNQPKPVVNTASTNSTPETANSGSAVAQQSADEAQSSGSAGPVQSEAQFLQLQKQMLSYFREKSKHGSRAAFARSVKWADLRLPPNESGKTRIQPPREASLNKITHAIDSENWAVAFEAAEDAFMEPGGLFCMELQRLSALAAQKAGFRSARSVIEYQVRELLERLPKLRQLSYDNGDPFAGGAALAWIEQITAAGSNNQGGSSEVDYLAEARKQRDEGSLASALAWLRAQISGDNIVSLRIRLAQAQLCHESAEPVLASSLLDTLVEAVDDYRLAKLVPDLAMAIWRQAWLATKDLLASAGGERQAELNHTLDRLHARMCATDLAQAAEWF